MYVRGYIRVCLRVYIRVCNNDNLLLVAPPPTRNSIQETTTPTTAKRQSTEDSHSHYLVVVDDVGGSVGSVDVGDNVVGVVVVVGNNVVGGDVMAVADADAVVVVAIENISSEKKIDQGSLATQTQIRR